MLRHSYTITREPTGTLFQRTIDYARERCDQFWLVRRHSIALGKQGARVLQRLQPFLLEVTEESQWPGTELTNETATVYRFALKVESASIIKSVAAGLYSWEQPQLPEDLCLVRPDGQPWLVTISHERDSYLSLSEEEERELLLQIPSLKLSRDLREG